MFAEAGGGGAAAAGGSNQHSRRRGSFNKPSWLLCNIADLDERIKVLARKNTPRANSPDTFSAQANFYYHERPQLLELLHDLYNGYLSLADRYCQALSKNQHQLQNHSPRCSSPAPISEFKENKGEVVDSDAESSLTFQHTIVEPKEVDFDMVVADLITKTVECNIILNEVGVAEKKWVERSRKMELQRNLVEVLESERLILLNNNATLEYRMGELAEENKGLASESMFLKRKASELARCIMKTREDQRVCMLSKKIEDLQGQIYGLEKMNREYYEQLMQQGVKTKKVVLCDNKERKGKCLSSLKGKEVADVTGSKWWDKVKKFDSVLCRTQVDCATSNT